MHLSVLSILVFPLLCLGMAAASLIVWVSQTIHESSRKHHNWPAFAKDAGGEFTHATPINPDHVSAHIAAWPFHLDTCVIGARHRLVTYTRFRAFYRSRQRFELVIHSADLVSDQIAATKLPMVTTTLTGGASSLVARSNNQQLTDLFLQDADVQARLASITPLDLRIYRRRNWHNGGISNSIYEVHLLEHGVITEHHQLMTGYELVSTCLFRLRDMGVALESFTDESDARSRRVRIHQTST